MPSFDIVSEITLDEVRNAVDQTDREVTNRYDFKGTNSSIKLSDKEMNIILETASTDRMTAFKQVLEEKLVKRKVSLKSVEFNDEQDAAGGRVRLQVDLKSGISTEIAKKINLTIKAMKLKGVQPSVQGEKIRVSGKKRDHLQEVIAALKEEDLDLALQFENFRD